MTAVALAVRRGGAWDWWPWCDDTPWEYPRPRGRGPAPRPGTLSADGAVDHTAPAFAHASEAEFARILDFYQVRWEYEPHVFPILWNLDGLVVESFAPDFWLPDLELYVEMTTLKQSLVRKKNRKLRRLRELYPRRPDQARSTAATSGRSCSSTASTGSSAR